MVGCFNGWEPTFLPRQYVLIKLPLAQEEKMAAKSCSRASAEFGRSRVGGNDLSSERAGFKRQKERESLLLPTQINDLWRQKPVSQ